MDWDRSYLGMITCIVLAIGIFVIDTLSPLEFAVAVLYVVIVVGAATYFKIDQSVPVATHGDLQDDAMVLGMPTRLGRMASQMASFLDQRSVWARRQLGSVISSTAGQQGG